jgi:mono/diheme cytochrome c family protein
MKMKRILLIIVVVLVGGFLLLQIIPYGHAHTNPLVSSEPNWDSPETRVIAQRACFDCHSNETVWPWYSNLAPLSWLVQHDVDEGRQVLNFSEWGNGRRREEAGELAEVIRGGYMPPAQYLLTQPAARLTDAEKQQLIQGLTASGISEGGFEGHEANEGDDD